jgi:hypothetical protein
LKPGIAAWVEYSRYADLGAGLIAYLVEGIGAGLLLAAALSRFIDNRSHFALGLPVYLAAAFAMGQRTVSSTRTPSASGP